jgi:hypothetical protein
MVNSKCLEVSKPQVIGYLEPPIHHSLFTIRATYPLSLIGVGKLQKQTPISNHSLAGAESA